MPSIKPEIEAFSKRPDGTMVEVSVDTFKPIPEQAAELRARGAAFAANGVATPPMDVIDDIKLGELKRATKVMKSTSTAGDMGTVSRDFTIKVDRPY